jgi:division protein CdvB (Snf7/Vps24/ESCRT-III family)
LKKKKAISEAEEARVAKEIAEQRLSDLLQRLKGGN